MPLIAFVRSPVAPLHAEPRISSGQVSQALFGHTLLAIAASGDWHHVRATHDGYEGWAHAGHLQLVDVAELPDAAVFAPYAERRFATGTVSGSTRDDVRATFGDAVPAISLGCRVQAGTRRLRLPLGALVFGEQQIIDGETVALDERAERFVRDGGAIAGSAWRFEGTSYQWGGVTPWGADCSGLVQSVFGLHGVELPRDAWQQALLGTDAGTAYEALVPGDLVFFSDRDDRRITHVGIALGEARMAHLALGRGGWAVETLTDDDDPYVVRLCANLVGARRML